MTSQTKTTGSQERLHYLDAVRAFALLLGVVFHASLSFLPIPVGWAVMDVSTSPLIRGCFLVSHSFRMPLFFLIAGYFSHMSYHRRDGWAFLRSRCVRLGIPFLAGWFLLWPLIASGWIMGWASMQGEVDILGGLKGGFAMLGNLPEGIFTSTHLWFLYYLLMVTAIVLALRAIAALGKSWYERCAHACDRLLGWLAKRWWFPWALAVPTARILWLMPGWGLDTPDKSLLPNGPVLLIYLGCFGLGWLLHRNAESLKLLTRVTWDRLLLTAIFSGAAILLSRIQTDPSHPQYPLARLVFVLCYAAMLWGCVLLTIGLFRLMIRQGYPWIRYTADASYWIYLVHLPIVVWLQIAVAEWPIHWSIKLGLVSLLTVLVALVSYHLLVRYTWLGTLLSGRRKQRQRSLISVLPGNIGSGLAGLGNNSGINAGIEQQSN